MYQFRHFNLTGIDIDKGKSANTHRKSSPHCQAACSHPTLAFQTCMRSIFPGSCSPCSPFLSIQHWQGKTQTKRFMAEQSIWISHTPSLVEDKKRYRHHVNLRAMLLPGAKIGPRAENAHYMREKSIIKPSGWSCFFYKARKWFFDHDDHFNLPWARDTDRNRRGVVSAK